MGSDAVVIDISSDEEDDCSWRKDGMPASSGSFSSELGENDDVIFVDEIPGPPTKRRREGSGCLAVEKDGGSGNDDDDCVILEADPDKPVMVDDYRCDGEDELCIVAEKGKLACRDYPHSRHLCATFPFSTSPHEKYCDLCHCYVCDSRAPCSYWGNGNSSSDHCHSTDKEGRWKALRQSSKQKNMGATQPPQQLAGSSSFNIPCFENAMPSCHIAPNPVLVPRSRSNSLWSSSATSISNSNTIGKRKQNQPRVFSCHNKGFGLQTTKSFPLNPSVEHVPRKSGVNATSTTHHIYSRTRYKRPLTVQAGFSRLDNPSCNTLSSNYGFPTHVPIASNMHQYSDAGHETSQDLLLASPGRSDAQMQATFLSKSTWAVMKDSVCPLVTAADIDRQSWQDILTSMAPEHRVPIPSDNSNIRNTPRPFMVQSQSSLPHDKSFSGTNSV